MLFRKRRLAAAILAPATIDRGGARRGRGGDPGIGEAYPPPSIHLLCTAAANSGTLEGSVCALPFGVTTAPNSYSATIAVGKAGAAGAPSLSR